MLAGISMTRTDNLTIRNVTVKNWPADGISLQSMNNFLVENCQSIDNSWTAYHPGTGADVGLFSNCIAKGNGHSGLFYCFGCHKVDIRDCNFSDNDGDGIGGLGIGAPRDTMNTIENSVFERNGRYGVHFLGGGDTGNAIRNCTVRDNSRLSPGKYPGIQIQAQHGAGAQGVTVENCTVESTLEPQTQWIGIEEIHAIKNPPQPKKGEPPSDAKPEVVGLADNNRIVGNKAKGHKKADIIVRGPNTVAESNTGTVIEERIALGPAPGTGVDTKK
jgi:polygalacturonase